MSERERRVKTDYGIDAVTFVETWEDPANTSLEDIYLALAKINERAGRPVMPKAIILSRASEYRSALRAFNGTVLRKLPRTKSSGVSLQQLADIVQKARGEAPTPKPPDGPPADPPPVDRCAVADLARETVCGLRKKK